MDKNNQIKINKKEVNLTCNFKYSIHHITKEYPIRLVDDVENIEKMIKQINNPDSVQSVD